MRLAWRLALRDLRGGVRGMGVVLACLALGVAAIAAVGSLRAAVDRGLAANGRALLGGDVSIESGAQTLPDRLKDWLKARGDRISAVTLLRTLAVAPSGERMLVELKAVDRAYPLVGAVRLTPDVGVQAALQGGVVVDPLVLQRLGLRVGDKMRLGEATLPVRAALAFEPDHPTGVALLGPRVMISEDGLRATQLIQPGSLVTHEVRAVLPAGHAPLAEIADLRRAFPETGWRLRDPGEAASGLDQAVRQTSLFLTLVGLSALLVGGIGVATGVRAWLEGRARSIATLRCLGAESVTVFEMFLVQIMLLCAAGILCGVIAGAGLLYVGLAWFGDLLPLPAKIGVYPEPLLLAAFYGVLTAGSFALWPLGRAAQISGAALFRDAFLPEGRARPKLVAANAAVMLVLAAAIVGTAADPWFALGFCLAALVTVGVFRVGALALMRGARLAPVGNPVWLKLGAGNLFRPASQAPLLLVSLGLGLAALSAVVLIEGDIDAQFLGQMPKDAPSFFFIDIQNDQLGQFRKIVMKAPGTSDLRTVPSLRARVVSLNGVAADRAKVAAGSRWALRGDRGLSYSATVPDGSRVVAGKWWAPDYQGEPLISVDDGLAEGWGLRVGDTIKLNVLGRDIEFHVANLRAIDWRALNINFTLVASPGLLSHAPQMHIATVREPAAEDASLLRAVNDALPNVTGIRVADVLAAVAALVGKMAAALAVAASVTLASGALVLAGAVAAGQRRRMGEAVVLKTLGATRAQIRAAWLTEFGAIGACAGVIAAAIGTLASYAVMRFVMHAPWVFLPWRLGATIGGCVVVMLVFGFLGTEASLRVRPAGFLRNE